MNARITNPSKPVPESADAMNHEVPRMAEPANTALEYELLEIQFHAPSGFSTGANPLQADGPASTNAWLRFADECQAALINRISINKLDGLRFATKALTVITSVRIDNAAEELARLQSLMEADIPENETGQPRSLLLTLQGAQILWQPTRVGIVAASHRLTSVIQSIVEATWRESQLRCLEAELNNVSRQVALDAPLAFEFSDRQLSKRAELAKRFELVLALRMLSVQLSQQVLVPHVYPPTLASQIAERLRERTRMAERLELVQVKLEAQERVYEMCSQRVSDFMLARQGHHLEWAIIIILLGQTLLVIIELLSNRTTP